MCAGSDRRSLTRSLARPPAAAACTRRGGRPRVLSAERVRRRRGGQRLRDRRGGGGGGRGGGRGEERERLLQLRRPVHDAAAGCRLRQGQEAGRRSLVLGELRACSLAAISRAADTRARAFAQVARRATRPCTWLSKQDLTRPGTPGAAMRQHERGRRGAARVQADAVPAQHLLSGAPHRKVAALIAVLMPRDLVQQLQQRHRAH